MRIFVTPEALVAGELRVAGDEHHYLARVRRARVGDAVELVDGAGRRAVALIERIGDAETVLQLAAPAAIPAALPVVRVLVPPIKGDRMELCLEKLVEVGADAITVWPAERAVVRVDPGKRDARLAKYRNVLVAAARQSGRAQIPSIDFADDLAGALAALPAGSSATRIVLDPTSDAVLEVGDATDVTIASGPEGGFAPSELAALAAAGFVAACLGPRVLRAETAPLAAVAIVRAQTRS